MRLFSALMILRFPTSWTMMPFLVSRRHCYSTRVAHGVHRLAPNDSTSHAHPPSAGDGKLVMIPESTWRSMATDHAHRLYSILEPGMTPMNHPLNSGTHYAAQRNKERPQKDTRIRQPDLESITPNTLLFRALDPKNPVFNFLVDYYGVRGAGSVRRLARWSPSPSFLSDKYNETQAQSMGLRFLTWDTLGQTLDTHRTSTIPSSSSSSRPDFLSKDMVQAIQQASFNMGGIFLENAQEDDFGSILHLRGMIPVHRHMTKDTERTSLHGVLYHPAFLHLTSSSPPQQLQQQQQQQQQQQYTPSPLDLTPFEWNYSLLLATKRHTPNLHCHGLHEWAMLYQATHDNKAPSSSMFQSHIPLRVSPQVIAETVASRGTNCTHFDALRFFSPSALPYNSPPYTQLLQRSKQLEFEQPACVHANMDLFKIALRLQPFIASSLIVDALEVALMARRLDVEASPYDVSTYGLGVVAVETTLGRNLYKKRQVELMNQSNQVRDEIIQAYELFLSLASFDSPKTVS